MKFLVTLCHACHSKNHEKIPRPDAATRAKIEKMLRLRKKLKNEGLTDEKD